MNSLVRIAALSSTFLLTLACSRQTEHAAQATSSSANAGAMSAEHWVDGVQFKGIHGAESARDGFTPGELIELSMQVEDAPQGTEVTTYWYGPDNRQLAYETKTVAPNQKELIFLQNNTFDWQNGAYRAEVWVGNQKVKEETFEIVAG